ncbi:RodZ domain-containing protein [Methylomagnum sp.]
MNITDSNQNHDVEASGSTPPHAAPHPGAKLREQREARNLSLETVARQLHLSIQAVRALEENDLAKLPPPVYVRGFLRSYARLVDMPEDEVVGALPMQPGAPKPSELFIPAAPAAPSRYWRLAPMVLALGAIGGLVALAVPYLGEQDSAKPAPEAVSLVSTPTTQEGAALALVPLPLEPAPMPAPASAPVTPALVPAPAPKPSTALSPPPSEPLPIPPASHVTEAPLSAIIEPSKPDAQQAPAPTVAPSEAPTPPPPPHSLVLRFSGESWASVSDATGRRLLYEAGAPGATKTVSGKLPLKVTLGRPANVSLEFNGQPFPHKYKDNGTPVRLRIGDGDAPR